MPKMKRHKVIKILNIYKYPILLISQIFSEQFNGHLFPGDAKKTRRNIIVHNRSGHVNFYKKKTQKISIFFLGKFSLGVDLAISH